MFNYTLPKELIAQEPKEKGKSRLLAINKGKLEDKKFEEIIEYFKKGDVLVLNNTKVFPARIIGFKETGGKVDLLLVKKEKNYWNCLGKGNKLVGKKVIINDKIYGNILSFKKRFFQVKFNCSDKKLLETGKTPLPPYIKKDSSLEKYQTVYAKHKGSIAAPTAGLHFTRELIERIEQKGVKIAYVTLHVGLGTFMSIKNLLKHKMHSESFEVTKENAEKINKAKRIIAVGTTTIRSLESSKDKKDKKKILPAKKSTKLFIKKGYKFNPKIKALITNFHLPNTTLLMLVEAFIGTKKIKKAYKHAINKKYLFYSFGDAMICLK